MRGIGHFPQGLKVTWPWRHIKPIIRRRPFCLEVSERSVMSSCNFAFTLVLDTTVCLTTVTASSATRCSLGCAMEFIFSRIILPARKTSGILKKSMTRATDRILYSRKEMYSIARPYIWFIRRNGAFGLWTRREIGNVLMNLLSAQVFATVIALSRR